MREVRPLTGPEDDYLGHVLDSLRKFTLAVGREIIVVVQPSRGERVRISPLIEDAATEVGGPGARRPPSLESREAVGGVAGQAGPGAEVDPGGLVSECFQREPVERI